MTYLHLLHVTVNLIECENGALKLAKGCAFDHKAEKDFAQHLVVISRIAEAASGVGRVQLYWLHRDRLHRITLQLVQVASRFRSDSYYEGRVGRRLVLQIDGRRLDLTLLENFYILL